MHIAYQLLRTGAEFEALRPDWQRLLAGTGIASPFLSWDWMFTWWQQYAADAPDVRLAVAVARRGDELVAILPTYVRSGGLFRPVRLLLLGSDFESSDYLQVIASPDDAAALLPELLRCVRQHERGIDIVEFANVLDGHPTVAALESFASAIGASCHVRPHKICPFIPLTGDWETYVQGLSAKMRKNVRRSTRQLVDLGAEFQLVEERGAVAPAIDELFALHSQRFATKGSETKFVERTRGAFHRAVAERFFDAGILRLFRVRVEGRTVASLYCFAWGDTLFYFQSGIDPAWERASVGTVLVGHAIKYACDHGMRMFDFMRGGEAYKFRWTDRTRDLVVVRVGLTLRGRATLSADRLAVAVKRRVRRMTTPAAPPPQPADADAA